MALMSDGTTHYKSKTLCSVANGLPVSLHFTVSYTLWSNGSIKFLGTELLCVFCAVISELRLDYGEQWALLPLM